MRTRHYFITAIALLISSLGHAQDVDGPEAPIGPTGDGAPPPPKGLPTPIDENSMFLFGAGALLAGYQFISYSKNKKTQSEI